MMQNRPPVTATRGRFCASDNCIRHTGNMKSKKLKIVLGIVLVPLIYWNATAAMIDYSVHYLSAPQSCTVLIPFNHTGFLTLMGRRSVPALRRQIADPNIGMNGKIHLAWVSGQMGDFSQFQVFIDGLQSKNQGVQSLAAGRMRDFPQECLRHLPAILAVGRQKSHAQYWNLLMSLAYQNDLPTDNQEAILQIISDAQYDQKGLNAQEVQFLHANFAAKAEPKKSRYWATGAASDKNSSNASRQ